MILVTKVVAEHPGWQEGAGSVVVGGGFFVSGGVCWVRTTTSKQTQLMLTPNLNQCNVCN